MRNFGLKALIYPDITEGVALSVISGFARWVFPTLPKHLCQGGLFAGFVILVLSVFLETSMRPNLVAAGLFLFGRLCIGGSIDMWTKQAKAQNAEAPSVSASPNSATPGVTITGGDNVFSVGQIGGITARVVNINPPINPELRMLSKTEIDNADGSHTTTIQTQVSSPITPGLLMIKIEAQEILNVSIAPPPTNGFSSIVMRNVISGQNGFSAEIPSPRGNYDIVVTTRSAVPIRLSANF